MISFVQLVITRKMTRKEALRLLLERDPHQAHGVLIEALTEQKSVAALADFLQVDVSTISRWCVSVANQTGKKDPRSVLIRRSAKTEFGKLVIEDSARARVVLKDLLEKYVVVDVAASLKVTPATIRRWKKALRLDK